MLSVKNISIFIFVFALVIGNYSPELSKCDCSAEKIPKYCFKMCQAMEQPVPPSLELNRRPFPAPGYGPDDGDPNPRPPPPPIRPPTDSQPPRRKPCPGGKCPDNGVPVKIPGWGGDCTDDINACREGIQPKPPANIRRKRGVYPEVDDRTRKQVPGFKGNCTTGVCREGNQPAPPNYPPRCTWKHISYSATASAKPNILLFKSSESKIQLYSPDFWRNSFEFQACLKDGSCGCWGPIDNSVWRSPKFRNTTSCEPYGCGYAFGESCGYKWTELYSDIDGYPGHTRIDAESKTEILRVMPHIDFDFANALFFLEPGFTQYIVKKHVDLPNLLYYMDEPVLYKLMRIVPDLDQRISGFTAIEISNVFCRVFDQCHFLSKFSNSARDTVLFKVKYLRHCHEKNRVPAPDNSMVVITPTTTTTAAPKPPLFTAKQISSIEVKIPKFRLLLPKLLESRVDAVKTMTRNLTAIFTELPVRILERTNNFLAKNADKMADFTNIVIAERIIGAPNDITSYIVRKMLV